MLGMLRIEQNKGLFSPGREDSTTALNQSTEFMDINIKHNKSHLIIGSPLADIRSSSRNMLPEEMTGSSNIPGLPKIYSAKKL
jgi:hypothetical protein